MSSETTPLDLSQYDRKSWTNCCPYLLNVGKQMCALGCSQSPGCDPADPWLDTEGNEVPAPPRDRVVATALALELERERRWGA